MMELLTRFVVAIESIANSLAIVKMCECDDVVQDTPPETKKEEPVVVEKPDTGELKENASTKYPRNGDRDAWLALCKDRKINVPPRTKTATLIKNVKSWDDARIGEAEFNGNTAAPEKEAVDPFAVVGIEKTETKAEEPITMKMVLEALQPIQKEKGNAVVIDILNRVGGVSKLIDLPEDKYTAVYKEAKNG